MWFSLALQPRLASVGPDMYPTCQVDHELCDDRALCGQMGLNARSSLSAKGCQRYFAGPNVVLISLGSQRGRGALATCYGLHLKCPPRAPMLKTWSPDLVLLRG